MSVCPKHLAYNRKLTLRLRMENSSTSDLIRIRNRHAKNLKRVVEELERRKS